MRKLLYLPIIAMLVLTIASCKKDQGHQFSYLVYENTVFTDVTVTANGAVTIIHPGSSATFTGELGAKFDYHATSTGQTSDGTALGVGLQWDGPDYFPTNGGATYTNTFKLDAGDFFAYITNNSDTLTVFKFVTNVGSSDQITDNITIGHDGQEYSVGYYKRYSNTVVRAYYNGSSGSSGYTEYTNVQYAQDANGNYYANFTVNN